MFFQGYRNPESIAQNTVNKLKKVCIGVLIIATILYNLIGNRFSDGILQLVFTISLMTMAGAEFYISARKFFRKPTLRTEIDKTRDNVQ